jgi:hypothetical protein
LARDQLADITAHLLGRGRDARRHPSVCVAHRRGVADDEYLGVGGQRQVRADNDTAGAVGLGAELACGR